MSQPTPRRGFATRAIRAATGGPHLEQAPTAVPIYQSATFSSETAEDLAAVFATGSGYAYARNGNPTADALGAAAAELEGAEAGYAFGSGMAAVHAALLACGLRSGDRVVATGSIYGTTRSLLDRLLGRLGVTTVFVDPTDLDAVERALAPGARVLYLETIANPTIVVSDIPALVELGHRSGAVVVVDNTFASPYLCRPIELGADLVVESATKWLGGHSDVLAGTVAGSADRIGEVRAVQVDTGGIVAPFSAFLVLRGMETLAVRMDRHAEHALAVALALEAGPAGADLAEGAGATSAPRVYYPGLPSHPQHALASRLLRNGGGMLAADFGRRDAAAAFIDALELSERTASLGSVHTIAIHPPSTSHRQLDVDALAAAGIPEGLVRISVGLEDLDDLLADVRGALAAAGSFAVATPV
jgi:cystathionine beta-lyase/cystathionine gamma-synthase